MVPGDRCRSVRGLLVAQPGDALNHDAVDDQGGLARNQPPVLEHDGRGPQPGAAQFGHGLGRGGQGEGEDKGQGGQGVRPRQARQVVQREPAGGGRVVAARS